MSPRRSVRKLLVAILLGVLVGGGLMAVTPAGAEVSQAVGTNWKKIWKKNLKPLATKSFYTKKQTKARFQPKGNYEVAGSGYSKAETYSKAEADAKYSAAGSGYTKAESDAKYAPAQPLYRGSMLFFDNAAAAGSGVSESFSFGATFPSAPAVHYIAPGAVLPVGCSGTALAPNAAPGHLCVFASNAFNTSTVDICSGARAVCGAADPFGAAIYTYAAAAGQFGIYASWAARPSGPVTNPAFAPSTSGDRNGAANGPSGAAPGAD